MAGAAISIDYEFKDKQAIEALKRLAKASDDLTPAFIDIGESLLNSTHQRFDQMVDPEGNPWAGLFVDYQKRKKKNKDKILVLEGFMRDTLAYNADNNGLELGTNRIYGATHQFGDEERGIVARPFLGVSDEDKQEIIDILLDHHQQAIK